MVSRKINELQLQREQPECQRLCALTLAQWQRRALLLPSAASHPTLPCPFPTAPLHLTVPCSRCGTRWPRTGWQVTAQHGVPHTSATFPPATTCRTRVGSIPVPPIPSFQPHPQRDRQSMLLQQLPGTAGLWAPPAWAPGSASPGDTGEQRGQQGCSGREEGAPAVAQASRELNMNSRAV